MDAQTREVIMASARKIIADANVLGREAQRRDFILEAATILMLCERAQADTFLGYRDSSGNEMHCANAFCPDQAKCRQGCINPVARVFPSLPQDPK